MTHLCSTSHGLSIAGPRRPAVSRILGMNGLLFLALSGLVALPLHAQEEEWQKTHDQIQKLNDAGRYSESLPLAIRNLQLAKDTFGLNQPNTATSLTDLGEVNLQLGEYAAAEPLLRQALEMTEKAV